MDLSAKDIEYQLVTELRLEEDLYMDRHLVHGLALRRRVDINEDETSKSNRKGVRREDDGTRTNRPTNDEVLDQICRHRANSAEMLDLPVSEDGDHAGHGYAPEGARMGM